MVCLVLGLYRLVNTWVGLLYHYIRQLGLWSGRGSCAAVQRTSGRSQMIFNWLCIYIYAYVYPILSPLYPHKFYNYIYMCINYTYIYICRSTGIFLYFGTYISPEVIYASRYFHLATRWWGLEASPAHRAHRKRFWPQELTEQGWCVTAETWNSKNRYYVQLHTYVYIYIYIYIYTYIYIWYTVITIDSKETPQCCSSRHLVAPWPWRVVLGLAHDFVHGRGRLGCGRARAEPGPIQRLSAGVESDARSQVTQVLNSSSTVWLGWSKKLGLPRFNDKCLSIAPYLRSSGLNGHNILTLNQIQQGYPLVIEHFAMENGP